jgi:hypothetical protein
MRSPRAPRGLGRPITIRETARALAAVQRELGIVRFRRWLWEITQMIEQR